MKTFIDKDPAVKILSKEIRDIDKKRRSLEKKMEKKVEKLISSRIKPVLSSYKWVASDDFYVQDEHREKNSFSLAFRLYEETSDVCSSLNSSGLIKQKSLSGKPANAFPSKVASKYKKSMLKPYGLRIVNPEIKTFYDLFRVMERWDLFSIAWNGVFISIGESSFKIFSPKGMDAVFKGIKDLGITLDMKSHLSEVEKIEIYLLKRKELISELSSKMLFGL